MVTVAVEDVTLLCRCGGVMLELKCVYGRCPESKQQPSCVVLIKRLNLKEGVYNT
jgi:hypothetical protein